MMRHAARRPRQAAAGLPARAAALPVLVLMSVLVPVPGLPGSAGAGQMEAYTRPQTKALDLPFSEAVRVGDTLYLSGQIGARPGTMKLVPGGMEAEARQTMENIGAVLAHFGADFADIAKCTVMLADMADWAAFNKVYTGYFTAPYPARSAFGASGLALGGKLELECIAVLAE